ADFVFDARFLPNPYWEPDLRMLTGRDPGVVEYLEAQAEVRQYLDDIGRFLETWLGHIEAANRSYLTVAIGCTGGRHRSVYPAERLAERFQDAFPGVTVRHAGLEQIAAAESGAPPQP